MIQLLKTTLIILTALLVNPSCSTKAPKPLLRVATYNVSLHRQAPGELKKELQADTISTQLQNLGAIIQHLDADILILQEFDYDPSRELLDLFSQRVLKNSQLGQTPIWYLYRLQIPSNTGTLADIDMDNDGKIALPNDAYGFGMYEGQYASAILSKFPFNPEEARSYQKFLWKDMPNAALPTNDDGSSFYSEKTLNHFRLSSKNHIDYAIDVDGKIIHTLISHPTPPVFDGPEDKNGHRNHDEIRLWKDYIDDAKYLMDDNGKKGGLKLDDSFIVIGDLNADPNDGDSYNSAINQLLNHPRINSNVASGKLVPSSKGGAEQKSNRPQKGDPAHDTSFFGLRVDYVLPSKGLDAVDSGVFFPDSSDEKYNWIKNKAASDHLPVWVDFKI